MTTASAGRLHRAGARVAARLLLLGVAILQRLPDRPVYAIGFRAGRLASRVMRERRELARANLGRDGQVGRGSLALIGDSQNRDTPTAPDAAV